MTTTIEIHIGEGTDIDGACFFAFEAERFEEGKVVGTHMEGESSAHSISEIQQYLTEEINRDEPISITGPPKADAWGTVRLPLRRGFYVVTNDGYDAFEADAMRNNEDLRSYVQHRVDEIGGKLA